MNYLRRTLALLLTWAVASLPTAPIFAQSNDTIRRNVVLQYDLDSTTGISCAYNTPRPIRIPVSAAASTTLAATTASTSPFALASVGDAVEYNTASTTTGGIRTRRWITAKASADSVTIDASTTVTAQNFWLYIRTCGTAATNGLIPVTSGNVAILAIAIEQMSVNTGGIGFRVEGFFGEDPDHRNLTNLWPGDASASADCGTGTFASGFCVYTAATVLPVFTTTPFLQPQFVRVVMKLTGTDDGVDTGAAAEKVTIDYAEISR